MDKGMVERGVQGNQNQLELDVNGDPVNCSNRLQEYGKQIRSRFTPRSSLLVISPFASDYLKDYDAFTRIHTADYPVRNYHGQIKWVLVREYAARGVAKKAA
jgi:class 3 adenylate cyclase